MFPLRAHVFRGMMALLAACALAPGVRAGGITYTTLDNATDPTFNQLLSINNAGTIAGYYGIGSAAHPNVGYTLAPPYGQANYTIENFPGAVQTQVTGINNVGQTVGFWADSAGDNFGWVKTSLGFVQVVDPKSMGGATVMDQVLGVNDRNQAVGFYTDAAGNTHGFLYDIKNQTYTELTVPNASQVTATDINNSGLISGFYTDTADGSTRGFLEYANGTGFQSFAADGSTNTMFFGLNNNGQEVGTFTDANGVTHGMLFNTATQQVTILDDPHGVGTTTINGVNDMGQAVGFYTDANGNVDGLLVTASVPEPGSMTLMGIGLAAALGYMRHRRARAK